jgi:hypothetical protein
VRVVNEDTDGPADERCDACGRLDPINCPCEPEEETDRRIRAALTESPEWPGPVVTTLRQTIRIPEDCRDLHETLVYDEGIPVALVPVDHWGRGCPRGYDKELPK